MNRRKILRLFSLLIIVAMISLVLPEVSPAQAQTSAKLKVGISTTSLVLNGTSVTSRVTVGGMPRFNSFDVTLKVDPAVLIPKSISITGTILQAPTIFTLCINGLGVNCGVGDGRGVAHLAARSSINTTVATGLLFKVAWKAINGIGSFGTKGSTVTIPCQVIGVNGHQITGVDVATSTYGTVPASGQPTAAISANQTSIMIKSNTTHSVTITVKGVNGFSGIVDLSATTSSSSITSRLSLRVLSCDCGAQPSSQLPIMPTKTGIFTVFVVGRIGATIIGIVTITVIAT